MQQNMTTKKTLKALRMVPDGRKMFVCDTIPVSNREHKIHG